MKGKKLVAVIISIVMVTPAALFVAGVTVSVAPLSKLSAKTQEAMRAGADLIEVLIETVNTDYGPLISVIESLGGSVGFQYKYVSALSADLPSTALAQLARNPLIVGISLNERRQLDAGADVVLPVRGSEPGIEAVPDRSTVDFYTQRSGTFVTADLGAYETLTLTPEMWVDFEPSTYANFFNGYDTMNTAPVWATGNLGQDSLAVIIDTGIYSPHFMLAPFVIGGEDMSADAGDPVYGGFDNINNHWHGTHVAGILAGHGGIVVPSTDLLALSLKAHGGTLMPFSPTEDIIWLLGIAPFASLYGIKIFDHTGAGVPEALVIAAIERAIDLKVVDGLDVDIISMSLGGATLWDGRDLEDRTVDAATAEGITVVSAAGNDGPASNTVGSPGSAHTGIAVAAAAHPFNTRVFWDQIYGVTGIGSLLFTSSDPQIYAFSSRGPTSDGRGKPELAATGLFVFSAYNLVPGGQGLAWASGTSMATPQVSGAVALLNTYNEGVSLGTPPMGATPYDFKQALTSSATPLPGYNARDQGSGYLNAGDAAVALLSDPSLGDVEKPLRKAGHMVNLRDIPIRGKGTYSTSVSLLPGHKEEFILSAKLKTSEIRVDITNVDLGVDLGLNSLEVYIQSAKRTTYAYFIDSANVWGDASFVVNDDETMWSGAVSGVFYDPYTRMTLIEPGFVKVVIENDWTSYDVISADVTITAKKDHKYHDCHGWHKKCTFVFGRVRTGETDYFDIPVPGWASGATIELFWKRDWTRYPTSDLDMFVFWTNETGDQFDFAATLNSPERFRISDTELDDLTVFVDGYWVKPHRSEKYLLKVCFEK